MVARRSPGYFATLVRVDVDEELRQEWELKRQRAQASGELLRPLPDDEYLTLKLSRLTSPREELRTGTRWAYYVLTKRDVVECRRDSIDAAELRQRADVNSLPHD